MRFSAMEFLTAYLLAALLQPFLGSVEVSNELDGFMSYFVGLCVMALMIALDSPVVAQNVSDGISGISERFMAQAARSNSSGNSTDGSIEIPRNSDHSDGYYDDDYILPQSSDVGASTDRDEMDDVELEERSQSIEDLSSVASRSSFRYVRNAESLAAMLDALPQQQSNSTSVSYEMLPRDSDYNEGYFDDDYTLPQSSDADVSLDRNQMDESEVHASSQRIGDCGSAASRSSRGSLQVPLSRNALIEMLNALAEQRAASISDIECETSSSSVCSSEWFSGHEALGYPLHSTTLGGDTSSIADLDMTDDLDIEAHGGNELSDRPSCSSSGNYEMLFCNSDYSDGHYDDDDNNTLPLQSSDVVETARRYRDEEEFDTSSRLLNLLSFRSLPLPRVLDAMQRFLAEQRSQRLFASHVDGDSPNSSVCSYEWFCGNEVTGYPVHSTTLGGSSLIADDMEGLSDALTDSSDIVAHGGNEIDDQRSANVSGSNVMLPFDSDYHDGYYDDDDTETSDVVVFESDDQNQVDEGEVEPTSQSIECFGPADSRSSCGSFQLVRNATFTIRGPDQSFEGETGCPREEF